MVVGEEGGGEGGGGGGGGGEEGGRQRDLWGNYVAICAAKRISGRARREQGNASSITSPLLTSPYTLMHTHTHAHAHAHAQVIAVMSTAISLQIGNYLHLLDVGAGFAARTVCSGLWVSHRPLHSMQTYELQGWSC